MGILDLAERVFTKSNRSQSIIQGMQSSAKTTLRKPVTASIAYNTVPILNRTANMLIDAAAECTYEIKDGRRGEISLGTGMRKDTLERLLNSKPNPFMDIDTFRRLIITDLLFNGSAFIYYDGASLYHVPSVLMTVVAGERSSIKHYEFGNSSITFKVDEIIFIKDNAFNNGLASHISGQSRIGATIDSLEKRDKMLHFKETFLDNGTVIGLIIETDDILNKKHRERAQEDIQLNYNPNTGQSTVLILDGGMTAKPYSQISSFKDLDFKDDIARQERDICVALGVPQVLIDGGNNANIRPNIEMFYYQTIIPMLSKVASSIQFFFGFGVEISLKHVQALRMDRENEAKRIVSLVNNGLLTGNEGRIELGLEPILNDKRLDEIRIPANVSGSATGVNGQEGGRPSDNDEEED